MLRVTEDYAVSVKIIRNETLIRACVSPYFIVFHCNSVFLYRFQDIQCQIMA